MKNNYELPGEFKKKLKKLSLEKKLSGKAEKDKLPETKVVGEGESELKLAPVSASPSDKKEGKILYRKSNTPSDPNIIDARGMSREEGKKSLELERLLREKKLRKKLMELK